MGTMACADTELLQRMLDILGASPNRIIVSKGSVGSSLRIPPNAWGEAFLPQTRVLPLVDLLIGHGGNNTFVEALHYGVPMLLNPFFGDQPDNAQRVCDLKLGDRFNAYTCDADELLSAVDRLLSDEQVKSNVRRVSQQMQSQRWVDLAIDSFEQYVATLDQNETKTLSIDFASSPTSH
jgi:UDP:flavonoid glycosyltransferase YjiC (YdhE family)